MYVEHTNQVVRSPFIQFVVTLFGPLCAGFAAGAVNGLRGIAETLFRMEAIHSRGSRSNGLPPGTTLWANGESSAAALSTAAE